MTTVEDRIEVAWQEHLAREWAQIAEWAEDATFAEFADWYAKTPVGERELAVIRIRECFHEITRPLARLIERWMS